MKHDPFSDSGFDYGQGSEPVDGAPKRADANRAELRLRCEVRQGTRPWKHADLEDISQYGFRIQRLPNTSSDTPLRIRIPGMQVLSAHVRWQRDRSVGCEFVEPLHIAVFEHIVREAKRQG